MQQSISQASLISQHTLKHATDGINGCCKVLFVERVIWIIKNAKVKVFTKMTHLLSMFIVQYRGVKKGTCDDKNIILLNITMVNVTINCILIVGYNAQP